MPVTPSPWTDRLFVERLPYIGTINLLHEAGFYDEGDVPVGQIFAALATPALLELARG